MGRRAAPARADNAKPRLAAATHRCTSLSHKCAGAARGAGGRDRLLPLTEDAHHADLTSYADPCRRRLALRDGGRLGASRPRFPGHAQARRGADRRRAAAAPAASREGLRIGLSDSGTKLVLPWFVTELTDAVNQGKSAGDTAKALAQGF